MLFVGRGGQGVVVASQILADTLARAGYWVQSFPEFKAERRGAPISAFMRWDETGPIHRRYRVRECDVLVGIAASPPRPEIVDLVRPGGLILLNRDTRFPHTGPYEIARVPASTIARRHGVLSPEGRPMGNMAVLGACVRLIVPHGLELLEQAIAARFGARTEENVTAAREGYATCTRQHSVAGDTPIPAAPLLSTQPPRHGARFPISRTDCRSNHTGSWSEDRPVLTAACTACAVCALFCPEGAIARTDRAMTIDDLYCKGCGICEVVCPVKDAIAMEEANA
jgi:2-oxoacid:acceptor oxidoreductase gamma subunit (pyruvate/2-ketoisovalerate family)/2-oxoacid:acceptor oxidoreductase delta subunit (pyruvate/2-ketoisovalerate family)